MNMFQSILTLTAAFGMATSLAAQESLFEAQSGDPVFDGCSIHVGEDIEVPAQEAGVLVHLGVRLGSRVDADQEIGQVDDREAKMQIRVARYAADAAYARATDDIEAKYSRAAAEVAKADHEQLVATNRQAPGAVPQTDIRRAKLEADRALLAIEKALHEQKLAKFDFLTRKAEVEASQMKVDKLLIRAPFGGEVAEVIKHQGEWVNPGEPIIRLIQLDKLYVDRKVDIAEYDPRDIYGCEVTVRVQIGKGRVEQVKGRIIHTSPLVRRDKAYRYTVRAEIPNALEGDHWQILPGLAAEMQIHLGTADTSITRR